MYKLGETPCTINVPNPPQLGLGPRPPPSLPPPIAIAPPKTLLWKGSPVVEKITNTFVVLKNVKLGFVF